MALSVSQPMKPTGDRDRAVPLRHSTQRELYGYPYLSLPRRNAWRATEGGQCTIATHPRSMLELKGGLNMGVRGQTRNLASQDETYFTSVCAVIVRSSIKLRDR
jgi:hypothetical protein